MGLLLSHVHVTAIATAARIAIHCITNYIAQRFTIFLHDLLPPIGIASYIKSSQKLLSEWKVVTQSLRSSYTNLKGNHRLTGTNISYLINLNLFRSVKVILYVVLIKLAHNYIDHNNYTHFKVGFKL